MIAPAMLRSATAQTAQLYARVATSSLTAAARLPQRMKTYYKREVIEATQYRAACCVNIDHNTPCWVRRLVVDPVLTSVPFARIAQYVFG